jgi:hypothetical protein
VTAGQTTRTPAGGGRDGAPTVAPAEPRSYYGEPILAGPVWAPEIAAYLFVGGLAGASAPLSALASLAGNRPLARRAAAAALAGAAISPVLLIKDLGRPERFYMMLRVAKVSSPMSVGVWILSGFGAAVTPAAARELLGVLPRTGRAAQLASLVLGPALSTYTAALLAATAVPAWHEARRDLPALFAAGSAATAGALAAMVTPVACAGPARALAVGGGVAEVAFTQRMEHRLGELAEPYHREPFSRAAKALTAAGTVLMAVRGALERWAVFQAGNASARDPKYTVGPQRSRVANRPTSSAEPSTVHAP